MKEGTNIVVKIKATNIEQTPALEEYARKRLSQLEKFLKHYSRESGELVFEIEIGKTTKHHKHGDVFRAEINFTAGGNNFYTESTQENLYAAIDKAKDELARELRRHKNKHHSLVKRGGAQFKKLMRFGKK